VSDAAGNRESLSRLEAELGDTPPPEFAQLSPAHLDRLADTVTTARKRQSAEIAAAADRGLDFIPRLLRGPIRKVLR